jgi:hypothetical protein
MVFRTYHPGPPLGDFVDLLWLYEGFARPAHERERLLPDGSVEVVFNLAEDKIRLYDRENTDKFRTFHGSIVSGPHTQFFVIDTAEQDVVAGIHFKPGGAYPFLKMPSDELHNQHVGLEEIWGRWQVWCASSCLQRSLPRRGCGFWNAGCGWRPGERWDVIPRWRLL